MAGPVFAKHPPVEYRYRWYSRASLPERHGQLCRITKHNWRGWNASGSGRVMVAFEDGVEVEADRKFIRTRKGFAQGRQGRTPR